MENYLSMQTNSNIILLFSTRIIRLFCYGFLSVVLALYLSEAGLTEGQIGLLFTLTLVGDAVITLWLTTDRKSTRLNSSHMSISYAVFCLKKKIEPLTKQS